jgi:hypothetical protein
MGFSLQCVRKKSYDVTFLLMHCRGNLELSGVSQAGLLEELEAQNTLLLHQHKHIAQLQLQLDQLISQEQLRAEYNSCDEAQKENGDHVTSDDDNHVLIEKLKEENVSLEAQVHGLGTVIQWKHLYK